MLWNSRTSTSRCTMRISSGQIHHGSDLFPSVSFWEIVRICQRGVYMVCRPLKNIWPCPKKQAVGSTAGVWRERSGISAIKSLYKQSEVCVRVNGMKTKPFNVNVGLQQGCVLSFVFIIYMDKIERDSSSSSGVTFGKCNVRRLLFADDLALLSLKVISNMHLIGFLMLAWMME